jgi:hypothetical protein
MLTIILDDENISKFLIEYDDDFYAENEKLYYKWDDYGLTSPVYVEDITDKRGIVHSESH